MRNLNLISILIGAGLIVSNTASALDMVEPELSPTSYAHLTTMLDPETGEEVEKVIFGGQAIIWGAGALNQIFQAYGLELDAENVEGLPSSFATTEEVENEEGEKETVVRFKNSPIIWNASHLNRILNAYGAQIDPEKVAELPSGFANVKMLKDEDGEEKAVVIFNKSATIRRPASFHRILGAYDS